MLAALVPVKSLGQTKGRMAELLGPEERSQLCLAMLTDVLAALRQSPEVALIGVISPDAAVAELAQGAGAEYWPDRAGSLNGAVAAGLAAAAQRGATAALVLPGDVPLVTAADVRTLVEQGQAVGAVVAPTGDNGTGALLLRPPLLIQPDYGGASAPRHLAAARAAGARAVLCPLPHLELDLDRPADLRAFWAQGHATATRACIERLGLGRWLEADDSGHTLAV